MTTPARNPSRLARHAPIVIACCVALAAPTVKAATLTLLSAPEDPLLLGTQGDRMSSACRMSDDGNVVAFTSLATQLVPGDDNGTTDVFVRDRAADTLTRISVRRDGSESDGAVVLAPAISGDGRYVAFLSTADLIGSAAVPDDKPLLYRFDRDTGDLLLVSKTSAGVPSGSVATAIALSDDGRYIAFDSDAPDLRPGDSNGVRDVFRYDAQLDRNVIASRDAAGTQATVDTFLEAISGDGTRVMFTSSDDALVPGDGNGLNDVFVKHVDLHWIERVSVDSAGIPGGGGGTGCELSSDGRYATFVSAVSTLVAGDTNGLSDLFVHDLDAHVTVRANVSDSGIEADAAAACGRIDDNGTRVWFATRASFTPGGLPHAAAQGYLKDLTTGGLRMITGVAHPLFATAIDGAGQLACGHTGDAIDPLDRNHVSDVYLFDLADTPTFGSERISDAVAAVPATSTSGAFSPSLAGSGAFVVLASTSVNLSADASPWETTAALLGNPQIYRRDLADGTTTLLTDSRSGSPGNGVTQSPALSPAATYLAYHTSATTLTNFSSSGVLREHVATGARVPISLPDSGVSGRPDVADNGAVVYQANGNVSGDANGVDDIWFANPAAGITRERISVSTAGVGGGAASTNAHISADGMRVVFESLASNLDSVDWFSGMDVFLRDRLAGTTTLLTPHAGPFVGRPSCCADIDASGNFVVFHSSADDLVAGDGGGDDVFLYDVSSGVTTRVSDGVIAMGLQRPTSPTIAPGGDYVAFAARNFVGQPVIVRYERATGELLALHPTLPVATTEVGAISISDDGREIVFETDAALLDGDDNGPDGTDVYRWSLTPGSVAFTAMIALAHEGTTAAVGLTRTGGSDGQVVAYVMSMPITATVGLDYVSLPVTGIPVTWAHGDTRTKWVPLSALADSLTEPEEMLRLQILRVDGGELGTASKATVVIRDP